MQIALLPGDGIGPEVIQSVQLVLEYLVPKVKIGHYPIGFSAYQTEGEALPARTLEAVRNADAAVLGAVTTPVQIANYVSPVLQLRQQLDLFANIRPVMSTPLEGSRAGLDLVIVRENSEGLYSGRETLSDDGETAIAERVVTRAACQRIAHLAYRAASQRKKHVTIVHKGNVLRETCGLFLRTAEEVATKFEGVATANMLVDTCAMRLIRDPENFDVILTTNLFGDILSDEAAELVGGLGLATSANIGQQAMVFEPVHGSAPDIAEKGTANPLAALGALALMFKYLDQHELFFQLDSAIAHAIRFRETTPDLGGQLGTKEVTRRLIARL